MVDATYSFREKTLKLNPDKFRELRDIIYERSGIFFGEQKLYLLETRLSKRIAALGLNSFDDYIRLIRHQLSHSEEFKIMFNNITINETFFFRYHNQLEVFVQKLLPQIAAGNRQNGQRKVRIWSAGCSSGEEIYTIAMMLKESLNGTINIWDMELLATDISQKMLDKATLGEYTSNSFRQSMVPAYKSKYFKDSGNVATINTEIRRMVRFRYLNLNDINAIRANHSMDVIFCRNVLIYFDEAMKKRVIRAFYDVLNHGGYLFLGETESIHGVSSAFKVEHYPGVFIYKKE
ncbi:MAG: protein-glutamate O-methyltransferase CheR [Candidatus Neomarinimicrobiota bacterium]